MNILAERSKLDKILLTAVFMMAVLGIMFVYSATWTGTGGSPGWDPLVIKQCVWVLAGSVLLLLIANINYLKILDFAYLAYGLNLVMLLFLLVFGGRHFGARRWIDLGFFSLQPSEFVKITAILVLANYLGEKRESIGTLRNFMGAIFLIMPAALLIFLQPDLGTSFVLVPILFSVLFICGERISYIAAAILMGVSSIPFFWHFLKDYQKTRLLVFMNPNLDPLGAGYTIIQSKIAVGSGGLFGKGWLNGTQSYLRFLPERHSDFIFSVIGEEWGFVGAVALIILYCVFLWRGIRIMSTASDIYGRAIATGVVTLIAFQMVVNIAMTIGLMPVVGLPLPLTSYGGSNALTTLIGAGFLLSVGRRARK